MTPIEELEFQLERWNQAVHWKDTDKMRDVGHDLAVAASQVIERQKRRTFRGFLLSFIR